MCDNHISEQSRDTTTEDRRSVLQKGLVGGSLAAAASMVSSSVLAQEDPYAEPENGALPPSDMQLERSSAALVITDPQIDFLSPQGVTWELVGPSVTANKTVENIDKLFAAAKQAEIPVAISPHYYYPTDKGWAFEGALEKVMHAIGMFDRPSPYSVEGFENSGADFMPEYKDYIFDGKTIICSPHKVYGPEQNDLVLQLRKNKVDQVVLAGMSANLCTQAHMHELLEQGL